MAETSTLTQALVAWAPLVLLLVALFVYLRATSRHYRQHVDEVNSVNQQIVDTNREMITELKEIKEILKGQS